MVRLLIEAYSAVVLIAVVLSWVSVPEEHPLVRLIRRATEPALAPIRRVLPTAGGFDFSPIVLLLLLQLLKRALG